MLRIVGEPGHLEVHQADRDLGRRDPDPEHLRPAGGNMLEQVLGLAVIGPALVDDAGSGAGAAWLAENLVGAIIPRRTESAEPFGRNGRTNTLPVFGPSIAFVGMRSNS